MPEYLRPLEIQLTIPHPAWIDVFVWYFLPLPSPITTPFAHSSSRPGARESIIRNMDWSEFEILRVIGNDDISINWPHGLSTVFMNSDGVIRMSPKFERHIRTLENWTTGGKVQKRFPFLTGVMGDRV